MIETPILVVKDLVIQYVTDLETVHAVNNISFTVNRGETLGIVGETGAGKTTTALSILRLLPERTGKICQGDILLDGKSILAMSNEELLEIRGRRISMIFQDPMTSLNPVMKVGDQVEEVLTTHNKEELSKDELKKRVDTIFETVGIPASRKNEYPRQFSGGMKQRVVIAMALVGEPDLLIADEPTTALDVTIQAQVLHMMKDLKKRLNTAMIMITHDMGIVAQTCDKVAVMYAGEILEFGTLEDIFTGERHHPYTDSLFGAIPDIDSRTRRLKPIDGLMPDPTSLPEGCPFSPRCKFCTDLCRIEKAPYYTNGTHSIKCYMMN